MSSFLFALYLLFHRHQLHLAHNAGEDVESGQEDKHYDVEMTIDDELFEDDVDAIEEGDFVSFKYVGEYAKGLGRPMNPKVPLILFSSSFADAIPDLCAQKRYQKLG